MTHTLSARTKSPDQQALSATQSRASECEPDCEPVPAHGKAHPILFSGPMIRALLDGRKTQTRRVLKPAPYLVGDVWWIEDAHSGSCHLNDLVIDRVGCMKYQADDRLWVREAWRTDAVFNNFKPSHLNGNAPIQWEADGARSRTWRDDMQAQDRPGKLRPGMFMPRWASRLTLIVTDVRVQRLREISEDDARAEGCEEGHCVVDGIAEGWWARDEFRHLWDSLNAKRGYGWDANPWVVALTFTIHRCNIDQMGA